MKTAGAQSRARTRIGSGDGADNATGMPIIDPAHIQAVIRRRHPHRGRTAMIAMYTPKAMERISLVRNK